MRLFVLCIILAMSVAAIANGQPKTFTEADAKKLVDEFTNPSTEMDRRQAVGKALAAESPVLCQKALKVALAIDERRMLALTLALNLEVPGLFETVKKWIDTSLEEDVVKLGLATQDKGAVDFLFDRWKAAKADTASFKFVTGGFSEFVVQLDVIKKFKPFLDSADKCDAAATIVCFQFALDDDLTPKAVLDGWDSEEDAYKRDSVPTTITGVNLLKGARIGGTTRKIGGNVRVLPKGVLSMNLNAYGEQDFTLTFRIRVPAKADVQFGLAADQGTWSAHFSGREWISLDGTGAEKASPLKIDDWNVVRFSVTMNKEGNKRKSRICVLSVNDTVLVERGTLNGNLSELTIDNPTGDPVVLSGVQLLN